jgi:hypothetical protein
MAAYKPWDDHSARWKASQRRKGLTPKRWDAWLKLSASTRRATNIEKYALGVSVKDQKRQGLLDAALANTKKQHGSKVEDWRVRRGLRKMSNDQLRWTAKASKAALVNRAKRRMGPGEINLWWY